MFRSHGTRRIERPAKWRKVVATMEDLHRLTLLGDLEGVRQLLMDGAADPNLCDERGHTPLHLATGMGHYDIVRLLLLKGADVNAANPQGQTPLHFAAIYGLTDVARVLAENGADPTPRDQDSMTAHDRASGYGYQEIADLINGQATAGE